MASRTLILLCVAVPLWAGEFAILSNGFRIRAERHESEGAVVRLYTGQGVVEIPAREVAAFEAEDYVAPPALPVPASQPPPPAKPTIPQLVTDAADRWGLPASFVHSVAQVESAYRPDAVSPKGAVGVMQLMPATAQALQADPQDPRQNIEAGVRYLRELLLKYGGSAQKALAAYNAGPGAVDRYNDIPPYRETQLYVQKVLGNYERKR